MMLSEKLQLLRSLEGTLRGLRRPLAKSEVARLIQEEIGESISQAYLSQLESGKREHMTARTRELLARFFKVHPGFLVDDPEGFQTELTTAELLEQRVDGWLLAAAQDLERDDPDLALALRELAGHSDTRQVLLLLARLSRHPELLTALSGAARLDRAPSSSDAGSTPDSAPAPRNKERKPAGRKKSS